MNRIAYNCPKCGKPGEGKADPGVDQQWVDTLAKLLHCNRCADFLDRHCVLERRIRGAAFIVLSAEHSKDKAAVIDAMRDRLIDLTKTFAHLVCDFYRKVFTWEPDFVEQLIEKPEKAGRIIQLYEEMIRK